MHQRVQCDNYEVDLNPLLGELSRFSHSTRILVHAPNGLKHIYPCIENVLKSVADCECYFSASPGYGACDIPVEEVEAVNAELLVHIGHVKYPLSELNLAKVRVVYVPVYYTRQVEENTLRELLSLLKSHGGNSVTLSSTLIELYARRQVAEYLRRSGIVVHELENPVLGCFYSHVVSLEEHVDAHVIVSGGVFHPLGLGLLASKPVIALDPYMSRVWLVNAEAAKTVKKRLYVILRAKESGSRVGLIIGARPGQHRPSLIALLEKEAFSRGYRVYRIVSSYLTLERLIAIDSALNLDFYVVSSCPRLPIDDLAEFHKPVLTPGEFLMLTRGIQRYVYPW